MMTMYFFLSDLTFISHFCSVALHPVVFEENTNLPLQAWVLVLGGCKCTTAASRD